MRDNLQSDNLQLNLRRYKLGTDQDGCAIWEAETWVHTVSSAQCAIIICDMWDNHWSRGAVLRVNAMVNDMNQVINSARNRGVHIIHAPSDTMDFYADSAARLRIQQLAPVEPPTPSDYDAPPLPIDASDYGSDTGETETWRAWSRQHPALEIDEDCDVISDQGQEIYTYLHAQNIQQVLILGVHTNMCILNRSFAIKQMVRWGMPVALVRDLTDTMYNPARSPYVDHMEGTRLVLGYIEKFWCPTLHSRDLLAA